MSFHYPRRVKDLPTLDPDSEDECDEQGRKRKNKENGESLPPHSEDEMRNVSSSSNAMGSSAQNTSSFYRMRMYPKRRSELPALESDSDDEDNIKNDNLNCAILNDSFIMSPGRSEADDNSILLKTPCDSAVKKKRKETSNDLSVLLHFDKMAICDENKENCKTNAKEDIAIPTHRLQSIQEHKIIENDGSQSQGQVENLKSAHISSQPFAILKDIETPLKHLNSTSATSATDNATSNGHFITPQIRCLSTRNRFRSTQSQKTRSAMANEFRSQKVLFQTPMAISRAPISCLTNDSLTLSLCDTINETGGTPSSTEKTPHQNEDKETKETKSKKSLEGAFTTERDRLKDQDEIRSDIITPTTNNVASASTNANDKADFLHINNFDYSIVKKLGCGGSSSVYLARRNDNGKEYALKVVDLRGDPIVVEGYLNETKLLAKLQGNVCVVALYEYQLLQKESKLFLVMEKGDSDLHKILQTYTTNLPLYVLMNFLYQMFQAVNYIHQNGVIHSDLKPANFLMVNGRLKLIDFGIASNIAIDSTSIIKFSQAGTFNYISPEALTDTSTGSSPMRNNNQPKIKISTKSDVWSLGCILYLFLYKKTPFNHIKNIYAKINAICNPTFTIEYPAIPPYYPNMLVHMLKNCLQHNPKKRPSCAELLQYPFHMIIPIHNLAVSKEN